MAEFDDKASAAISKDQLSTLGQSMAAIVIGAVDEFLGWQRQYMNWCNMQMANMQPIPPQADAEFQMRLAGITTYLHRFEEAARILDDAGISVLKEAVELRIEGLGTMAQKFREAQMNMARDNARTNNAVQDTWNQIGQDNLAAEAARQNLRNATFTENFKTYGEGLAARSASFTEMNQAFLDSIKGD